MNTMDVKRSLSIRALRDLYVKKVTTPQQVLREIVERAYEDAEMNIWITPPRMDIVQPYLDRLDRMDPADHPLWGIPFAIKDNIDLAGVPTTAACPAFAYQPDRHAVVVERLVAAGAIPIGKTNLDQFATGLVGTRSPYGETWNSFRNELISGGSSSGSAVAVARGHASFALGTDTAGSGRVPAALNRLVGFKPTLGAWPTLGVVPACGSLDCVAVFTHDVEDAVIIDRVVRGISEDDPWSRSLPHPVAKHPDRIVVPEEIPEFFGPYAEHYRSSWLRTIDRLLCLDIPVERVPCDLFMEAAAILYEGPWVTERWSHLGKFVTEHPDETFKVTEQVLRSGQSSSYDAVSLFRAIHRLQEMKLASRKLLRNAVLVMPTVGGTWTREQVRQDPMETNRQLGRYTNHCNLLDLCAMAIPSYDAEIDIPFGVTLFALSDCEGLLIGAAEAFRGKEDASMTQIAVCGLHMRGYPLEKQMLEHNARFLRVDRTAPIYKLYKLPTEPIKPGLVKQAQGGSSIELEVWEMPQCDFGAFAARIPAPLGIGKVKLMDGVEVSGFLCEGYAVEEAEDVSSVGGWRYL